jgi:ABC-type proline/glycine betaine transport system ATPase subunit
MDKEIKLTKRLFLDHGKDIEKVLQRAVNHALLRHKRLGNPIAIWKDGQVVIVPPEEIVIPPDVSEPNE